MGMIKLCSLQFAVEILNPLLFFTLTHYIYYYIYNIYIIKFLFKCFLPLEKLTANCKLQTFWGVLPVASMGVMLMVNRVISSGLSEIIFDFRCIFWPKSFVV